MNKTQMISHFLSKLQEQSDDAGQLLDNLEDLLDHCDIETVRDLFRALKNLEYV